MIKTTTLGLHLTLHPRFKRDGILVAAFALLSMVLIFVPTGFENRMEDRAIQCKAQVTAVDNSSIQQFGMIKTGDQQVTLQVLDGSFKGRILTANNPLLGQMDRDKIFKQGDLAFVVLSLSHEGEILFVNPQAHYRIGTQLFLLGLFCLFLLIFGGWTGLKALLSFFFSGLMLWKVLVPLMLKGIDPVWISLSTTTLLTGAILFLVAGLTKKGVVAFLGAFLGIFTSCLLALYFTDALHIHGAVMPFSETLLYSGFGHLNLTRIYTAAVFLAASGAVMDLAMDVSASMDELVRKKPGITSREAAVSGLRIGRSVVGTMTTTLLFAYSGGYITLLMAFMAQGVPLINLFNLVYVAAEVLKTLVGSFGMVAVAPFTALVGALVFTRK